MLLRGFVRMEKSSSLSNLPVKQLISLCKERHVNPSGCVEKQDIVRALKDAGGRKFNKTVEGLDCSVLDNDCEVDLLCVLIHGYGSNKEDLLGIGTQLMPNIKRKVRFVCPNGPISLGGSMSSWYDVETILEKAMQASNADILSHIVEMCPTGLDTSSEKIARLIDSLVESEKAINKDFSRSNVILGGFSQGSSLSLDCAIMHGTETPFHSLFLWSGMALRNSKLREKQKDFVNPSYCFASHGTRDPVVPFPLGLTVKDLMSSFMKENFDWAEFPGQHQLPPSAVKKLLETINKI